MSSSIASCLHRCRGRHGIAGCEQEASGKLGCRPGEVRRKSQRGLLRQRGGQLAGQHSSLHASSGVHVISRPGADGGAKKHGFLLGAIEVHGIAGNVQETSGWVTGDGIAVE